MRSGRQGKIEETAKMANEIAVVRPTDERVAALDAIAKESQLVLGGDSPFKTMFGLAQGVQALQGALTPELMAPIMALQNKALGFRCDKTYPVEVVKDAIIEATIRGLQPTGNEFNIIGGRCYITKEGFGRLLANIDGLKYMITPGIPRMTSQGAEAPVNVRWKYRGEEHDETLTFPVRVNSGMGADAINGKATRKARAWLYAQVTGMELGEGDVNDSMEPINVTPKESRFDAPAQTDGHTNCPEDELAVKLARDGISIDAVRKWHETNGWPFDAQNCLAQYQQLVEAFNGLDVAVKEALNG
jgi:hypothetical protein